MGDPKSYQADYQRAVDATTSTLNAMFPDIAAGDAREVEAPFPWEKFSQDQYLIKDPYYNYHPVQRTASAILNRAAHGVMMLPGMMVDTAGMPYNVTQDIIDQKPWVKNFADRLVKLIQFSPVGPVADLLNSTIPKNVIEDAKQGGKDSLSLLAPYLAQIPMMVFSPEAYKISPQGRIGASDIYYKLPLMQKLSQNAQAASMLTKRFPGENAWTLAQKGRFNDAKDWLGWSVLENAPSNAAAIIGAMAGAPWATASLIGLGLQSGAMAFEEGKMKGVEPLPGFMNWSLNSLAEAGFERMTQGAFLRAYRTGGKIIGKAIEDNLKARGIDAAKATLKDASLEYSKLAGAFRIAKGIGEVLAPVSLQEGEEEILTQITQDITSYVTGVNPDAIKGMFGRAISAFAVGAASGAGMVTPSGVFSAARAERAERFAKDPAYRDSVVQRINKHIDDVSNEKGISDDSRQLLKDLITDFVTTDYLGKKILGGAARLFQVPLPKPEATINEATKDADGNIVYTNTPFKGDYATPKTNEDMQTLANIYQSILSFARVNIMGKRPKSIPFISLPEIIKHHILYSKNLPANPKEIQAFIDQEVRKFIDSNFVIVEEGDPESPETKYFFMRNLLEPDPEIRWTAESLKEVSNQIKQHFPRIAPNHIRFISSNPQFDLDAVRKSFNMAYGQTPVTQFLKKRRVPPPTKKAEPNTPDVKPPSPELEKAVDALTFDELTEFIDSRYEAGATQPELDYLEMKYSRVLAQEEAKYPKFAEEQAIEKAKVARKALTDLSKEEQSKLLSILAEVKGRMARERSTASVVVKKPKQKKKFVKVVKSAPSVETPQAGVSEQTPYVTNVTPKKAEQPSGKAAEGAKSSVKTVDLAPFTKKVVLNLDVLPTDEKGKPIKQGQIWIDKAGVEHLVKYVTKIGNRFQIGVFDKVDENAIVPPWESKPTIQVKIIVDGDTGVAQGALDTAVELGLETGGTALSEYVTSEGKNYRLADYGLSGFKTMIYSINGLEVTVSSKDGVVHQVTSEINKIIPAKFVGKDIKILLGRLNKIAKANKTTLESKEGDLAKTIKENILNSDGIVWIGKSIIGYNKKGDPIYHPKFALIKSISDEVKNEQTRTLGYYTKGDIYLFSSPEGLRNFLKPGYRRVKKWNPKTQKEEWEISYKPFKVRGGAFEGKMMTTPAKTTIYVVGPSETDKPGGRKNAKEMLFLALATDYDTTIHGSYYQKFVGKQAEKQAKTQINKEAREKALGVVKDYDNAGNLSKGEVAREGMLLRPPKTGKYARKPVYPKRRLPASGVNMSEVIRIITEIRDTKSELSHIFWSINPLISPSKDAPYIPTSLEYPYPSTKEPYHGKIYYEKWLNRMVKEQRFRESDYIGGTYTDRETGNVYISMPQILESYKKYVEGTLTSELGPQVILPPVATKGKASAVSRMTREEFVAFAIYHEMIHLSTGIDGSVSDEIQVNIIALNLAGRSDLIHPLINATPDHIDRTQFFKENRKGKTIDPKNTVVFYREQDPGDWILENIRRKKPKLFDEWIGTKRAYEANKSDANRRAYEKAEEALQSEINKKDAAIGWREYIYPKETGIVIDSALGVKVPQSVDIPDVEQVQWTKEQIIHYNYTALDKAYQILDARNDEYTLAGKALKKYLEMIRFIIDKQQLEVSENVRRIFDPVGVKFEKNYVDTLKQLDELLASNPTGLPYYKQLLALREALSNINKIYKAAIDEILQEIPDYPYLKPGLREEEVGGVIQKTPAPSLFGRRFIKEQFVDRQLYDARQLLKVLWQEEFGNPQLSGAEEDSTTAIRKKYELEDETSNAQVLFERGIPSPAMQSNLEPQDKDPKKKDNEVNDDATITDEKAFHINRYREIAEDERDRFPFGRPSEDDQPPRGEWGFLSYVSNGVQTALGLARAMIARPKAYFDVVKSSLKQIVTSSVEYFNFESATSLVRIAISDNFLKALNDLVKEKYSKMNQEKQEAMTKLLDKAILFAGAEVNAKHGKGLRYFFTLRGIGGNHIGNDADEGKYFRYTVEQFYKEAQALGFDEKWINRWLVIPTEMEAIEKSRPAHFWWNIVEELGGKDAQRLLVYGKQVELDLLDHQIGIGIFDNTDIASKRLAGWVHSSYKDVKEVTESGGVKQGATKTTAIPQRKYDSPEMFFFRTSGPNVKYEGQFSYSWSLSHYAFSSLNKVNQVELINTLHDLPGLLIGDIEVPLVVTQKQFKKPEFVDLIKNDKVLGPIWQRTTLGNPENVEKFFDELGYVQIKSAPGLAEWEWGSFSDPWVHQDVRDYLSSLHLQWGQNGGTTANNIIKTALSVSGILTAVILVSPFQYLADNVFLNSAYADDKKNMWRGLWTKKTLKNVNLMMPWKFLPMWYNFAKKFMKGEEKELGHLEDMKDIPQKRIVQAMMYGLTTIAPYQYAKEMLAIDYKDMQAMGGSERFIELMKRTGGLRDVFIKNILARTSLQAYDALITKMMRSDPAIDEETAARYAARYLSFVNYQFPRYAYGNARPFVKGLMFAADVLFGQIRILTGATADLPGFRNLFRYHPEKLTSRTVEYKGIKRTAGPGWFKNTARLIANIIFHGEASQKEMQTVAKYYRAQIPQVLFLDLICKSLVQFTWQGAAILLKSLKGEPPEDDDWKKLTVLYNEKWRWLETRSPVKDELGRDVYFNWNAFRDWQDLITFAEGYETGGFKSAVGNLFGSHTRLGLKELTSLASLETPLGIPVFQTGIPWTESVKWLALNTLVSPIFKPNVKVELSPLMQVILKTGGIKIKQVKGDVLFDRETVNKLLRANEAARNSAEWKSYQYSQMSLEQLDELVAKGELSVQKRNNQYIKRKFRITPAQVTTAQKYLLENR